MKPFRTLAGMHWSKDETQCFRMSSNLRRMRGWEHVLHSYMEAPVKLFCAMQYTLPLEIYEGYSTLSRAGTDKPHLDSITAMRQRGFLIKILWETSHNNL